MNSGKSPDNDNINISDRRTEKSPRVLHDNIFERAGVCPKSKRSLVSGIISIIAVLLVLAVMIYLISVGTRQNSGVIDVKANVSSAVETYMTAQPTSYSTPNDGALNDGELSVTNLSSGKIEHDSAPLIVAQVLENEMGGDAPKEALKAGAVAIYSYLLYYGADSGKNPSATMIAAGPECISAAYAVQNQTVKSSGRVIEALMFDISAGKTADNSDVWGNNVPYLKSVDSSVDLKAEGFKTIRTYSADNVAKWIKAEYNVDIKRQSDKTKWFICKYDKASKLYATSVSLGGLKTVSGMSIRYNLFNENRVGKKNTLNSHAFTVKYDKESDSFIFTVKGRGNGVGMSIEGAKIMAQNGADYKKILQSYYTGVAVG